MENKKMTPESTSTFQLTKTNFNHFLECPREFWLRHHRPEAIPEPIDAHSQFLIRQGYEVERIARAVLQETIDPAVMIPQHTVTQASFLARFDIFRENPDGSCSIYEVKSSKHIPREVTAKAKKEKRELNLYDLGFQIYVARLAGLDVSEAFLVTIDGEYERGSELNFESLIHFEDVTNEIELIQSEIARLADAALALINADPGGELEELCAKKLRCPYFAFFRPDLPDITIYDIPGLRGDRFEKLKATGVLAVTDIVAAHLTPKQWAFVESVKHSPELHIKHNALHELLETLEYPLYFLDYETVNPAIPQFEGMRPYEQITFQFSVISRQSADGELKHLEFLSDGYGELQRKLVEALRNAIGDTGTVISWNKSFEKTQNRLLARLYPEYAGFFESLNERMFDLAIPFQKGLYNDPEIKGWSIKRVLPILVPDMSYDSLGIAGGALASAHWYLDVFTGTKEKEQRMRELREYCKQDTLAMVRILEVLSRSKGGSSFID